MQAFKLYFKIARKSVLAMMLMYIGIFVTITILMSQANTASAPNSFATEKCRVMLIDNDGSDLSKELVSYVNANTKAIKIKTDEDSIRDALFYKNVELIGTIPQGFEEDFLAGKNPQLSITQLPDSAGSIMVQNMINSYLSMAHTYLLGTNTIDYNALNTSMSQEVAISIHDNNTGIEMSNVNYFFNYLVYPFLACFTFCISYMMLLINETNVKRRNSCAPIKSLTFSIQVFLANMVFAFLVLGIFLVLGAIMYPNYVFSEQGFFWVLNTFVLTIVCMSLSFLIGNIAGKNAVSGISNCVSLGACFLGGVFVPQEMLSTGIKNISALVNPAFWFIKASNHIGKLSVFTADSLAPVFQSMIIQLGFAAAFFAISLVIIKYKRTSN